MHFGLVLYVYTPSRKVATTAEVEEHKHNARIQPSLLTSPWPVPGLADCPRSEGTNSSCYCQGTVDPVVVCVPALSLISTELEQATG